MGTRIVLHLLGWLSKAEASLSSVADTQFCRVTSKYANLPSMFRRFTVTSYLMISGREKNK